MVKFHSLKVASIDHPTDEAVVLTFDVPEDLKQEFRYKQGQHITLKKDINGEDTRRSYSICSCPLDEELKVAVKKVEGGRFSTFANDVLQAGQALEVLPPTGKFNVPLDPANQKTYVAFAAGSGITPIISIIETTLRTEPKSEFTLFYGNRKTNSIIFLEELEALKNKFVGRFSMHHILNEERVDADLYNGRIDAEKMAEFAGYFYDVKEVDHFFTCGPEPMMLLVKETLIDMGVPSERVHLELFTSPLGKLGGQKAEQKPREKAKSEITIQLDGHSTTIPYNSDESILDVAFNQGLDLPYACKGGVCSTCVCKVEEGEVDMDINYALEPDELERGLVLSCQARPKTDKVTLNFDV